MSIRSSSFLGLSNFDDALVPDDGEVTIDLSRLEFIDAYGLVGLASHVVESALEGRDIYLITPDDRGTAAYLSRMHVSDLVRDLGVKLDRPSPGSRSGTGRTALSSCSRSRILAVASSSPTISGIDSKARSTPSSSRRSTRVPCRPGR